MNIEHRFSVGCTFAVEVFNEDGEITYRGEPFHNTVLDSALLGWWTASIDTYTQYINIGSSSVAPDPAQTGLLDRKFSTNSQFVGMSWTDDKTPGNINVGLRKVFQFNIGTCTGDFTEVGLSAGNNSSYFNRQLFKNSSGDPIVVRVLASEGLRLTVEIKVYADPTIVPYGCIYKLDTKGATGGSVVIGRSGSSKSLALSELIDNGPACRDRIEEMTGNYLLLFVTRDTVNPSVFWIYFRPDISTDPNLTMLSHSFTGCSDTVTFENTLPFNDVVNFPPIEYDFEDTTNPSNNGKLHYKKQVYFSGYYDSVMAWSWNPYQNQLLLNQALNNLGFHFQNIECTSSSTTTPTAGNLTSTRKNYYAPGKFTTGAPINITWGELCWGNSTSGRTSYSFRLVEPIAISNTEEIEFSMTFSWGRYTP